MAGVEVSGLDRFVDVTQVPLSILVKAIMGQKKMGFSEALDEAQRTQRAAAESESRRRERAASGPDTRALLSSLHAGASEDITQMGFSTLVKKVMVDKKLGYSAAQDEAQRMLSDAVRKGVRP